MKLSLISPVFNEESNIPTLYETIIKVLQPLKLEWELIFVDDGSTDNSLAVMNDLVKKGRHRIQVIELRKNYGQTAAIAAGIAHARGDVIILLDADMQNDPADIPLLLAKLDEGYDVVSGWRKDRKDKYLSRILPSRVANWMISTVTGVKLHDYGCTLKAYKREFLGMFNLYGEMHRFIPVYAEASGAKIAEIVVTHHPRKFGKSKYGFDRVPKVILDLITVKFLMQYSAKPMRIFGGVGIGLMLLSSAVLLFLAIRRIITHASVLGSPFFVVSILGFILGFQAILLGMIAELLIRTYYETQGKSTYAIRAVHSSDNE